MWSLSNRTRHLSSLLRCSSSCSLLFFVGPKPSLRSFTFIRHFDLSFRRLDAVGNTAPKQNPNEACAPQLLAMAVNEYNNDICRRSAQSHAPYTVFIEGNVGSGKTTFLEQFGDCPNVFMAKEPVHKWQDVCGHNFLVSVARKIGNRVYFSTLLTSLSISFVYRGWCIRIRNVGALRSSRSCRGLCWNCTKPDPNTDKTSKLWNGQYTALGIHNVHCVSIRTCLNFLSTRS